MKKITKKDIKDIGDRYLCNVDFDSAKGTHLRIDQIKYAEWFSVVKYGTATKAKRAARIKRDTMLLSGDYGIILKKPPHQKKPEDKLPATLTRNNADLFALLDLAETADKLGIITTAQLKYFIVACMFEGASVMDMNGGESKDDEYKTMNCCISTMGEGKPKRPGRGYLRKGDRGSATGGKAGVSGEWNRRAVLVTDSGLKAMNQLLETIN